MKFLKFGLFFIALLFAGCKSTKDVVSSEPTSKEVSYIRQMTQKNFSAPTLTAKAEVELILDSKNVALNGNLRMKRDDVVQLSLTFFGIEVVRMEFTPEEVLVIDRANKRYLRAQYNDVQFLQQAGLDFYALQALFWNEVFVPGTTDAGQHLSEFNVQKAGDETILLLSSKPKLNYEFRTETKVSHLTRTTVTPKQGGNGVYCAYDNFKTLEKSDFPTLISLGFSGQQNIGLTLKLSKLNSGDTFSTRTEVSSRYKALSAEDLFGALSKLLP